MPAIVMMTEARETIKSVAIELNAIAEAATAGLMTVAKRIEGKARSNMAQHHYEGRAEKAITSWVSFKSPNYLRVSVGIKGNTFAPEGATFEKGWYSERGLTPPSAPFAEWALRRGIAKTIPRARQIGFIIAFRQGQKPGYSFDTDKWLTRAWQSEAAGGAEATVKSFIVSKHARVHDASGRFSRFIT